MRVVGPEFMHAKLTLPLSSLRTRCPFKIGRDFAGPAWASVQRNAVRMLPRVDGAKVDETCRDRSNYVSEALEVAIKVILTLLQHESDS